MESRATVRYLRSTARKARLVADAIRNRGVGEALSMLSYSIKKEAAEDFGKLLKSAVANLQNKNSDANIDVDELRITEVRVDEGPTQKRFRARAQGRAGRILKRSCHITVTVSG